MSHLQSALSARWAVLTVLSLIGCQSQQATPQGESRASSEPKMPAGAATTTAPSAHAEQAPLSPSKLDDAQIGALLVAMSQGEIRKAELAEPLATAPDVRGFATQMKTAHTAMLSGANDTLSEEHIAPIANALSDKLGADVATQVTALKAMHGAAFDQAYIEDQVKAHEAAALLLDDMMTGVTSPKLKLVLQREHGMVEDHLGDALHVERAMRPGVASMQGKR